MTWSSTRRSAVYSPTITLLDDAEPALTHFVSTGVLVNLFNEPMTERIGNPESAPNDPHGHRLQQQRIPSIHLHPIHPPYKPVLASVPTPDGARMSHAANVNEP